MDYFIADTHFGHKNIVKYTGRPSNYVGLIMAAWRKTVKPEDTVYHLGDVSFLNKEKTIKIMKFLPGKKLLLRGNHDHYHGKQWFLTVGFEDVIASTFVYKEGLTIAVVLTHAPLGMEKQKELTVRYPQKIIVNIHGHIHEKNTDDFYEKLANVVFYNISVEQINMTPITLEEIFIQLYAQKKLTF